MARNEMVERENTWKTASLELMPNLCPQWKKKCPSQEGERSYDPCF